MDTIETGLVALRTEALELVSVSHIGGDQATATGHSLCFIENIALFWRVEGDLAILSALGPRVFEL